MKSIKVLVALVATMISGSMFGQTITASDVTIAKGGTADVTFSIESTTKAALAELVMTLPEGITVKYDADEEDYIYEKGSEMTGKQHVVNITKRENGDFYVLVYHNKGKEFSAESGAYLTVTLEASENAAGGDAILKDILLVAADESKMNTVTEGKFTITIGGTDGISSINADEQVGGAIYNLAGQKVNKAQKGVYIQNGKKVVMK